MTEAVVGSELCPEPHGVGLPMTHQGSWDWKLPTPPQPSQGKTSKKPEAWQMAFRDAMDLTQSPSMSWEDQVQEEEEQERCSSTEGDPKPGSSPPPLEGDSVSDVSMVDEGLLQCDSDMIVEEEREEGMETDALLDLCHPHASKGEGHVGRP